MKQFFLLFFSLGCSQLFSQSARSYTINPDETFVQKIPLSEIYEYTDFKTGYVIMKNNTGSTVKLNYNRLYQEIVFIAPSGDTLALAEPELVKVVQVNNDEFYFATDRFVKVDTTINNIKIATAHFFTETKEREVGYGKKVESSGLSHQAYILPNSTNHIGQKLNLSPNDIITLYPKTEFVLLDENNTVYEVSRKNLFKIFNKDENKLKNYLTDKKPSFKSREDLITLVTYITSGS